VIVFTEWTCGVPILRDAAIKDLGGELQSQKGSEGSSSEYEFQAGGFHAHSKGRKRRTYKKIATRGGGMRGEIKLEFLLG